MIRYEGNQRGEIDCFGQTERGRVRDVNSDQFLVGEIRPALIVSAAGDAPTMAKTVLGDLSSKLLLVADGIGKGAAGERAANLAVEEATRSLITTLGAPGGSAKLPRETIAETLRQAFHACQERLLRESRENPDMRDLGTTLTIAYVNWPHLWVAHAGDSRCYLYHNLKLSQLTTDHTMAERFIQEGLLDARAARNSRWNHVLWNAIGTATSELSPQIATAELAIGDALVLCTDGLTRHLSDHQISQLLRHDLSAEESALRLTQAALNDGGTDNVTIIISRFRSQEHQSRMRKQTDSQRRTGSGATLTQLEENTVGDASARVLPKLTDAKRPTS